MSTLRIFDVSIAISAGSFAERNFVTMGVYNGPNGYAARAMPCGGMAMLFNAIEMFRYEEDAEFVFCCDRPSTFKRELHSRLFPTYGGYKGGRPKKKWSIPVQRKYIELILKQIGFNVVYREDYEADDCIAAIVRDYKDYYDNIYIHTKDSDLAHLVCNGVSIHPITDKGKYITIDNYYDNVSSKEYTVYNCVNLNKILYGERSDNIPAIPQDKRDLILRSIPESEYPKLGDSKYLRKLISEVCLNDEITMGITDLILPRQLPVGEIELYELDFNEELFIYYSIMMGCYFARSWETTEQPLGNEVLDAMLEEYIGGGV